MIDVINLDHALLLNKPFTVNNKKYSTFDFHIINGNAAALKTIFLHALSFVTLAFTSFGECESKFLSWLFCYRYSYSRCIKSIEITGFVGPMVSLDMNV